MNLTDNNLAGNGYALRIESISKAYTQGRDTLLVLDKLSLVVEQGMSVVITGDSGSGKTSLLSIASGLDSPDSGKVYFMDQEYSSLQEPQRQAIRASRTGFVFQFHYLLEDLTVLENIMIPLLIQKKRISYAQDEAYELLEKIGLVDHARKRPPHLSGGECQRVAVARALVHKPAVLFADEPTGSLDEKNADEVIRLMFDLVRVQNASLIMVTHNKQYATLAHQRYHLSHGTLSHKGSSAIGATSQSDTPYEHSAMPSSRV